MDAAVFRITEAETGKVLLDLDYLKWENRLEAVERCEKLSFLEHPPPPPSSPVASSGSGRPGPGPVTFDDTLLFIAAAQDAAYGFFGKLMEKSAVAKAGLDDDDDNAEVEEGGSELGDPRRVAESFPVSEWSQDGEEPAVKKARGA